MRKLLKVKINQPYGTLYYGFTNGSKVEDSTSSGLMHLIEHLFFKDSSSDRVKNIIKKLSDLGCSYNAYTSHDHVGFYCTFLYEDYLEVKSCLDNLIFNVSFTEDDFNSERKVVLREISDYLSDPSHLGSSHFIKKLYGDFIFNPLGDKLVVSSCEYSSLLDLFKTNFGLDNLICIVLGEDHFIDNLDLKDFEPNYTTLSLSTQSFAERFSDPHIGEHTLDLNKKESTSLFMGNRYNSKYRTSLELFSFMLSNSMDSPFFVKLRETLGLCYGAYAYNMHISNDSCFVFYSDINPDSCHIVRDNYFDILEESLKDKDLFEVSKARKLKKIKWESMDPLSFCEKTMALESSGVDKFNKHKLINLDFASFKKDIVDSGILSLSNYVILKCI